ncbi:MAG: sulfite exporter TauE/SafE family protein [Alphaproteobacteria bacterium]|nr:sulfite exporter TauE/SafE family protein [Alphaproteobacteria bacterium]
MGLCLHDISAQAGLFTSLLLAGLAGGFTHCALMCGPFILAQQPDFKQDSPLIRRLTGSALLPYHLGRITTYVLLAFIFSSLINAALIFSPLKALLTAVMLFLAAIIFMVNIFPVLTPAFPFVARIGLPVPQTLLGKLVTPFTAGSSLPRQYILGLLLGFMPCGLVVAALMTAVATQNPVLSAAAMAVFGLGTVPALVFAASGSRVICQRWPQALPRIRAFMLIISTGLLITTAGHSLLSWS